MTRSISLAVFFVLILAAVFWFTRSKNVTEKGPDSGLRMLSPRVQIITQQPQSGQAKFQFAISTDPSPLSQMNRESASVATRVRPSVALVSMTSKEGSTGKSGKKSATAKPLEWITNGVLIGAGDEILSVIPPGMMPSDIHVRFQDGTESAVDFIGRDDASEIALLRLPAVAAAKPLVWRNRRSMEWGEHFYVMGWDAIQGAQMARVMVSGDAVLFTTEGKPSPQHFHQLDQVLSSDFTGAVVVDGSGELAGLVIQPDAPDQLRALVLDAGAIRVVTEALRSLEKKE